VKIRWSPEAEQDRWEITDYIAADNPVAAEKISRLFDRALDRVSRFPLAAREGLVSNSRELIPHPSYRIVYEIRADTIWVAAIFHTARQWPPVED
jgi:addiction module RelE/StbE family toxin